MALSGLCQDGQGPDSISNKMDRLVFKAGARWTRSRCGLVWTLSRWTRSRSYLKLAQDGQGPDFVHLILDLVHLDKVQMRPCHRLLEMDKVHKAGMDLVMDLVGSCSCSCSCSYFKIIRWTRSRQSHRPCLDFVKMDKVQILFPIWTLSILKRRSYVTAQHLKSCLNIRLRAKGWV